MTSPPATAHPTSGRAPADPWPAPLAAAPVNATVPLPGSKSQTNRALVLAALAEEPSRLLRPLRARDTLLMAAGLRSLGVGVDEVALAAPTWRVTPAALRGPAAIDCGLAGTVMRFLPPVATLARGNIRIDGDPRARQRPLRPLLEALRTIGADLDDGGRGALPVTVHGHGRLPGGEVTLDASSSSQLVSGLLLAAPRFDRGVRVRHVGPPVPSQPHLDMTVDMLDTAGAAAAQVERGVWTVTPGPLRGLDVAIEPDLSNAAPFLAAALVTGGEVRIPDWPTSTRQPGAQLVDLLGAMGAAVVRRGPDLSVRGTGAIHGIDADLRDVSELTPVIAAVAALADSPSYLRGIGHLRGHETDRLAALATELSGLGGDVTETADGLRIRPRRLRGGVFATYDDHRLATAAAVVGLVVPGVLVVDVATTAKTLPDFVERWARMLGAGR